MTALIRTRVPCPDTTTKKIGAYVKNPIPGIFNSIYITDFSGLYPSIMRTLNIGAETYIAQMSREDAVDYLLDKEKNYKVVLNPESPNHVVMTYKELKDFMKDKIIALNGAIMSAKQKSFTFGVITVLTDLRKKLKVKAKKDPSFRNKEKSVKILNNSQYGVFGFERFRFYNPNIVNAITLTGQFLIKTASVCYSYMITNNKTELSKEEYINCYRKVLTMYLEKDVADDFVLYSDTDSVDGNSIIESDMGTMSIAELFNRASGNPIEVAPDSWMKNVYLPVFTKSFDIVKRKVVDAEIKYIKKHKVTKNMYRIVPKSRPEMGVIVTEDHSLLVARGVSIVVVKPTELQHGDRLILKEQSQAGPLQAKPLNYFTDDFEVTFLHKLTKTVYDIEVDNDSHCFFANDILVHNSVFINMEKANKEFMDKATEEINKKGWKVVGEKIGFKDVYLLLDYKGVGSAYFTDKKKKYATYLEEDGKVEAVGLDSKVSVYPQVVRDALDDILNKILVEKKGLSVIKNLVEEYRTQFIKMIENWDKRIGSTVSYNKRMDKYKKVPSHVFAMELYNLLIKNTFHAGMKGMAFKAHYEKSRIPADKMKIIDDMMSKYGIKSLPNMLVVPQDEEVSIPDFIIPDVTSAINYLWNDRIDFLLLGIEQKQGKVDLSFDF